jgi:hypothetical protein
VAENDRVHRGGGEAKDALKGGNFTIGPVADSADLRSAQEPGKIVRKALDVRIRRIGQDEVPKGVDEPYA